MTQQTEVTEIDDLNFELSKDLRELAQKMTREEAVQLVRMYYRLQDSRIRAAGQGRALGKMEKPHALVDLLSGKMHDLEKRCAKLLDYYSANHPVAIWARSHHGVGPVLSSALLALIDPVKTVTAGDLWAFAGLVPGQRRERGKKSNWNSTLKTTTWKLGHSFVMVSGKEDAFYGQVFRNRKEYESKKSEAGEYAEQAQKYLAGRDYGEDTKAKAILLAGKLPPFLLQLRSERYAAKLFLAHFLEVLRDYTGQPSVAPWVIVHGGHAHYIAPPNWTKGQVRQIAA